MRFIHKKIYKEYQNSKNRKSPILKLKIESESNGEFDDDELVSHQNSSFEESNQIEEVLLRNSGSDLSELIKIENARIEENQVLTKEEKFIQAVYPQFKGKTKLDLIDNILDFKRQIEILQEKANTFENTINRLLD